ncbi:dipeptidase [Schleiferiaceae bacterium]|nr:dipeptidase [Schleiferiaceae bacterium]MDC3217707.1 dipeptidase [Schleiferiaceae bacterium]
MTDPKTFIEANKERLLDELFSLLRIPSISADPAYNADVAKCAEHIAEQMKSLGLDAVEIFPTAGHPIVYGECLVDPDLPTVLVYGHYDVQPADPIDLWDNDPFEPIIKNTTIHPEGAIFARGACDDKGQMFMHLKAFEIMKSNGEIPCNIKFMIEGEEEVGSSNLEPFVASHKEKLACDTILISDTGMISNTTPSITTGLRGLSYVEVEVTGANRDLHSGLYGGAVANPLNVLAKMVASLHDDNGQITVEGFYDGVEIVSTEERALMAKAPFSQEEFKESIGIGDVWGEEGYSTPERTSIRPTLDVNGMWGGYTGEGAKTVIPSKAYAKISMRLVPGQNPEAITEKFIKHFKAIAPDSVAINVTPHHGGLPYVTHTTNPAYQAASKAYEKTFGKAALPVRSGGSIPIVALFEQQLGTKSILMGFGLDSDAIHSPNEHYGVFNYFKGIETIPYFYENYAKQN